MIRVLHAGLHTSIQDMGRSGYRNYGVPIAGVMDHNSALHANMILKNHRQDAVMEITLQGPRLQFLTATKIALTGACLTPTLNTLEIPMNTRIDINKGDIITFGRRTSGVRCYLAVNGGFQTDLVLNSRSFYEGITQYSILKKGDEIPFHSAFGANTFRNPTPENSNIVFHQPTLEVYKGPEYHMLNEQQKKVLHNQSFTIGINNRMAYQLEEPLHNQLPSILSSAVLPGTIQLTPSGTMIILMRDCQTTGGYPRILQLSEASVNALAQKIQHDTVRFSIVENQVI